MTIDIIDLTQPEYSDLSPVQLSMVRVAQGKKNKIVAEAEEKMREFVYGLVANHTYESSIYTKGSEEIAAKLNADVETVREDLLYQLAYEAIGTEGDENGPYRYPENPNYNLPVSQRFLVVRQYYMEVTDDPDARVRAYAMDTLARTYLGEYYQTLYDLLASYC